MRLLQKRLFNPVEGIALYLIGNDKAEQHRADDQGDSKHPPYLPKKSGLQHGSGVNHSVAHTPDGLDKP